MRWYIAHLFRVSVVDCEHLLGNWRCRIFWKLLFPLFHVVSFQQTVDQFLVSVCNLNCHNLKCHVKVIILIWKQHFIRKMIIFWKIPKAEKYISRINDTFNLFRVDNSIVAKKEKTVTKTAIKTSCFQWKRNEINIHWILIATHFKPQFHFYTSWKR